MTKAHDMCAFCCSCEEESGETARSSSPFKDTIGELIRTEALREDEFDKLVQTYKQRGTSSAVLLCRHKGAAAAAGNAVIRSDEQHGEGGDEAQG